MRKGLDENLQDGGQLRILRIGIGLVILTFEFDAERFFVAELIREQLLRGRIVLLRGPTALARSCDRSHLGLAVLALQIQHRAILAYPTVPDEVQDVAQEAFIKAYRALPRFRGDSAFYTWLYRIAINTAKNYLVAGSRRPPRASPRTGCRCCSRPSTACPGRR